jgi:hypothetical protein
MHTCSDVQRDLSRYVDDDLPPDARAAIALHLASCEGCRGVETDLRQIRVHARTLGPVPPPEHVWTHIADRLRMDDAKEARTSVNVELRPPPPRPLWSAGAVREGAMWPWLSLAAALVVVALGTYVVPSLLRRAPATTPDNATRAVSVQDVAGELDQALAHYERAVAGLETLAREKGARLDPTVSAALRTNLAALDRAIAESRTALVTEPQSASARASLGDALRQKVDVLQTTVALVNEMRRDHDNSAANAAKSGRQS